MKVQIKRLAVLCLAILSWAACMKTENNVEEFFGEKVVLSLCPSGEILEVIDNPLSKAALPAGTLYVVSVFQGSTQYAHGVFDDPSQMSLRLSTGKEFSIQVKAVKAGVSEISHEGAVYSGNGTLDNAFHYYASDTTDGTLYGNAANIASLEDQWLLDTYFGATTLTPTAQTDNVNIMLYRMMHKVTVVVAGFEDGDGAIAFTQSPYLPGTEAFTLSPASAEYSKLAVIDTDLSAVVSAISGTNDYSRDVAFTAEYSSTVSGEPYVKKLLDAQTVTFRRNRETRITLTLSHNYLGGITVSISLTAVGEDMDVDGAVTGFIDSPEAVDLGLSVKWASFNLGASKPEEYGDYYAWGETETYYSSYNPLTWKDDKVEGYDWSSYSWCEGGENTFTKYNYNHSCGTVDNNMVLDSEDDVAQVKLGGGWRMPTNAEWTELRENCTWTWVTNYNDSGINGRLVTANKGNSIFLPAAGYRYYSIYLNDVASNGWYWSSSLYPSTINPDDPRHAWCFDFDSAVLGQCGGVRCDGMPVRPVLSPAVESISLNKSSLSLDVGNSATLTATVLPSEAAGLIVSWVSLDTSVATVSENGLVTAISAGTATIIASAGSKQAVCTVTVSAPTPAGAVDLGLSVYWATTNLGASSETGYGNYYYFGSWDWDLKQKGSPWRVPTIEEWHELQNNCDIQWTSKGGVNGVLITNAATNKSIFLSAGGYTGYYNDSYYSGKNTEAWYWSSSPTATSGLSCCAMFKNGSMPSSSANNYTMMLVRLVYPK